MTTKFFLQRPCDFYLEQNVALCQSIPVHYRSTVPVPAKWLLHYSPAVIFFSYSSRSVLKQQQLASRFISYPQLSKGLASSVLLGLGIVFVNILDLQLSPLDSTQPGSSLCTTSSTQPKLSTPDNSLTVSQYPQTVNQFNKTGRHPSGRIVQPDLCDTICPGLGLYVINDIDDDLDKRRPTIS
ncbi:hypothetical protein PGT21_014910 [Puccinia graminis f. sp. tritici]|uniref:Uncharacterized protein n=1 Tax=Puccinia graminis f. sp. tritici TaxID=56615 RepID=A0A5B0QT69_PUCGR|nr:hypothetical protein PGT21_014910 [Puccinia graminis f. sp. tritici]